jgi:hypothetical protein
MVDVLSGIETKLKACSVPVIRGKMHGSWHTLIETSLTAIYECQKPSPEQGSIAVIDVERVPTDTGADGDIIGIQTYVRLGTSNAWFYVAFNSDVDSEDDDDLSEYQDEPEVDSEELSKMALIVARAEGFGGLKNRRQRQELANSLLEEHSELEIPSHYAGEIVARAEGLYEFGVLPERVRALQGLGKGVAEIFKALGITRQRVEKAASVKTQEYIAQLLKNIRKTVRSRLTIRCRRDGTDGPRPELKR